MDDRHRIAWVDMARGLCMTAILLFHSEKYYVGEEIIPYALYVDNAIILFFFVSGYLFQNPQKAISVPHKLRSVLRTMIIPYFVFTLILALPKALAHDDTSIAEVLTRILTGHASWFIAALIVCQLLFLAVLRIGRGRIRVMFIASALPYLLIALLYGLMPSDTWRDLNLWCWQNACLLLFFLFGGFLYRRMEHRLAWMQRPGVIMLMSVVLIFLKYAIWRENWMLTLQPVNVTSFTLLLIDGSLGIIVFIGIIRHLPSIRLVSFTGRHSLYYYFICGGVPFTVSKAMETVGFSYQGIYPQVMMVFVMVYLISTIVVGIINRISSYSFFFLKKE